MRIELTATEAVNMDRLHSNAEAMKQQAQEASNKLTSEAMKVMQRHGPLPDQQPNGFRLVVEEDKVFLELDLPVALDESDESDKDV